MVYHIMTITTTSESSGHPLLDCPDSLGKIALAASPRLAQNSVALQERGTHQDRQHRGPHGDVLVQADVVEWLAEDGPVVVLVDEGDLHLGVAHVVGHTLVGKELVCKAGPR